MDIEIAAILKVFESLAQNGLGGAGLLAVVGVVSFKYFNDWKAGKSKLRSDTSYKERSLGVFEGILEGIKQIQESQVKVVDGLHSLKEQQEVVLRNQEVNMQKKEGHKTEIMSKLSHLDDNVKNSCKHR